LALLLAFASADALVASRHAVVTQNAEIAFAVYSDSLTAALELAQAVAQLVAEPTAENLDIARERWVLAREPYSQTEVYRFRNSPIDNLSVSGAMHPGAGPEGRINGWPLDEALIDYVAPLVDGNAVNSDQPASNLIAQGGFAITPHALAAISETYGNEANVATGYHAIEFLLWGQDLNAGESRWDGRRPRDASAGQRPASNYAPGEACTSGVGNPFDPSICRRRGHYLEAVVALLVNDLSRIVAAWDPGEKNNFYAYFTNPDRVDDSLLEILLGMGSMSYGELAGERILVALSGHSQEDEQSCFSETTHRDIYLNALGIQNTYLGDYRRLDETLLQGAGIVDLLAEAAPALEQRLTHRVAASLAAAQVLVDKAETEPRMPFDRMVERVPGVDARGQPVANANMPNNLLINDVATALQRQTESMEEAIAVLLGDVEYRFDVGLEF
jgi:putative iron-regulated protein